jgi:hypothetical protein
VLQRIFEKKNSVQVNNMKNRVSVVAGIYAGGYKGGRIISILLKDYFNCGFFDVR